jgi:hypothetical protein
MEAKRSMRRSPSLLRDEAAVDGFAILLEMGRAVYICVYVWVWNHVHVFE